METLSPTQSATKENIKKAIDWINTLRESDFTQSSFTNENNVQQHCVLGHLILNKSSPFYNIEFIKQGVWTKVLVPNRHLEHNMFAFQLNKLTKRILGKPLALVNNEASEGSIKASVL
jgi:hypothetical protein